VSAQTRFLVHSNGPALWPEHKPLREILDLKGSTMSQVWNATYQGVPTAPEGTVFKREWWRHTRYDATDPRHVSLCVARWASWDTALKDEENNAYSADVIGELMPDYRLFIRHVWRDRLQFPELPPTISAVARQYNSDGKLRGVLIEDKASGTSAYQTLVASAEDWLKPLLVPFQPSGDKETRAQQAAVWCANGSVWLPYPGEQARWLVDFEDELFNFPGSVYKDQVDAFSQLVLFTENLLAAGWQARKAAQGEMQE
jgi:predicted phage terminase large subunit-like protein